MSAARQQFTEWKVLHSKREWKENSSLAKAERKQILTNVVHLSGDMILLLDLAQQHRNSMIRKYMSQQLDLEYFYPFTNGFLAVYFQGKLGKQEAEWIEWDAKASGAQWQSVPWLMWTPGWGQLQVSVLGVSDSSCDTPMAVQWGQHRWLSH